MGAGMAMGNILGNLARIALHGARHNHRPALVRCALVLICLFPTLPAAAQQGQALDGAAPTYIQLESLPSLTQAEERARAYSAKVSAVAGFMTADKTYLIAIGPFSPAEAAGRITKLKSQGLILPDAFLTDGSKLGAQFWPVGAGIAAQPNAAAPQPQGETTPLVLAPSAVPTPQDLPAAAIAPSDLPAADETQREAMASEAALSVDEKIMLQQALQWYGFYEGALDGSFGRGTRASMGAWQQDMGFDATGVLTSLQRASLTANYKADQAAYDFVSHEDSEAGVSFMLASARLAFDHYEPPFVHYVAKDDTGLRLVVISEPGDTDTLAALYELLQSLDAMPSSGERSLDGDRFTLSGQSDQKAAFATAQASKGAIKGYMLLWDRGQDSSANRILSMMKTSFRSTGDKVLDPSLVPLDEAVKNGVLAGMAVKTPKDTISGIFANAEGLVLTLATPLESCAKITLDGGIEAEIIATDQVLNAALLRPREPLAPMAFAQISAPSPSLGAPLLLAGYSLAQGLPAPVLTQGSVEFLSGPNQEAQMMIVTAPTTPHDRGGPVLDMNGALIGIIYGQEVNGKTLPQGTTLALGVLALGPLLAQAKVGISASDTAAALSPEALSRAASGMTVQVACWP